MFSQDFKTILQIHMNKSHMCNPLKQQNNTENHETYYNCQIFV